jgi:hypothetical protein
MVKKLHESGGSSLKPHGVLDRLDRPTFLAMDYSLLNTLVTRQLMLGQSAVIDCLINDDIAVQWHDNVARYDSPRTQEGEPRQGFAERTGEPLLLDAPRPVELCGE